MILCHCAVVSDGHVATAVAAGARTVSQVCRATGAGRDCGRCVFSLKAVLCDHQQSYAVVVEEVEGAAS